MVSMMAGLSRMMAPAMLGMSVGSMVGHLATRAFGTHDLPIPREPATVTLVPTNIEGFAADWEIPVDEMRLWVLAHEFAGHGIFAADHVREALTRLVREHVGGFRPDPGAVADRLGALDVESADPMAALQQALSDPEVLLGAVTSPEQHALRPRLDALVAVVVGYTDWIVDAVAVRVVGGNALRIAEAVRRRRVETTASDTFVEQLLGIRLGDDQVGPRQAVRAGGRRPRRRHRARPAAATARRDPDSERARRPRPLARPAGATAGHQRRLTEASPPDRRGRRQRRRPVQRVPAA